MDNSTTDHGVKEDRRGLHLPKNIRQIGNMQGSVRIYMEDYVYTYGSRGMDRSTYLSAVWFGFRMRRLPTGYRNLRI